MPIRLQVLGGLHAWRDDVPLPWVPAQPINSALLVYLALERDVTREQLAHLLWPDEEADAARRTLRQALYRLRHAAGEALLEDAGDVLRLAVPVVCDAVEFERAVEASDFAGALTLYRGAFLKDVSLSASRAYEEWTDRQRARFSRLHRRACRARIEGLVHIGAAAEAIEAARAWVTLEPFDDEAQHRLIELLAGSGQRAEALRQFDEYERLLQAEELEPLDETKALVGLLRAGEVGVGELAPLLPHGPGLASQVTLRATPGWPLRRRRRWLLMAASAVIVLVALLVGWWHLPSRATRHDRTAIAVLPFENLGGEGPHAYLASALQGEVLTQLVKVSGLSVRPRTSVRHYAGTSKPLSVIADELSVGTVVEGSVQTADERLRVNVQVTDVASDELLWAEQYELTLADAFSLQSDIAQRIVSALGATLGTAERALIATPPTKSPDAYLLYLQGREYFVRPGHLRKELEIAQGLYERALALDPAFALVHAALARVHGFIYWYRYDPSPERAASLRREAETALRLAPALPEAHIAMANAHYFGRRDWRAALREYRIALEGLPNDADLWEMIGVTYRRLGSWSGVLDALDKVTHLDPRNADVLWDLGGETSRRHRRFREAIEWYDRALALVPDLAQADVDRGWTWLVWQGRLDSLRAAVERQPPESASPSWATNRAFMLYLERKPDSLLAVLARTPQPVFDAQLVYMPRALAAALAHRMRGDGAAARMAFDTALSVLDSALQVIPGDWRVHAARGLALAGLGRRADASREAEWLRQSQVYRGDAHFGPVLAEDRAAILAAAGEPEAAVQEIERLLIEPSWLTVPKLRIDPIWDPIRSHAGFQALLATYAEPRPVD